MTYLIPITNTNTLTMGIRDLCPQKSQLSSIESLVAHFTKLRDKVNTGNRAHVGRDVGIGGVESSQWSVPEVVTRRDRLHQIQGSISRSDDGDCARNDGCAVEAGQPSAGTQRLKCLDYVGPGRGTVGLDVDPEVEGLAGCGVEDAVMSGAWDKAGVGVLGPQDRENGLNVEGVEGTS